MAAISTVAFETLGPGVTIFATFMRAGNGGLIVFVHGFAVLGEVRAVRVAVSTPAAREGLFVCVGAFVS